MTLYSHVKTLKQSGIATLALHVDYARGNEAIMTCYDEEN